MKKALCLWLTLLLTFLPGLAAGEETEGEWPVSAQEEDWQKYWVDYDYRSLTVGNATPLEGKFFTSMWGGSTSDMDVQELLHGYNLVRWDNDLCRIRFNRSVVSGAVAMDDGAGNRTYHLVLYNDMRYSDGTPITAYDYAFSILLMMDKAVEESGGTPVDESWILGSDAYLSGESDTLSGLRILSDDQMEITVKAEALPYFYELARLNVKPYPIYEIAPGNQVKDDGKGAYLAEKLTGETLMKTVLDPEHGYLSHPRAVSGPYMLTDFDGVTATFLANNEYKGDENNQVPQLYTLYYTLADNKDMIRQLGDGEFGLLNKVTMSASLFAGIKLAETQGHQYTMTNYPRVGLMMVWFMTDSPKMQDLAVRQAVAYCLDRKSFVHSYVGPFGMVMDGFFGLGQWMYLLANGAISLERADDSDEETPEFSLDGLTRYELDVERAKALLEGNGWVLGADGSPYDPDRDEARYKLIDGELVGLNLVMGMPESEEAKEAMEKYFLPHLRQAGINVTLKMMDMISLHQAYSGENTQGIDLEYIGENFPLIFDTEVFLPRDESNEMHGVYEELYDMAKFMVRTEPTDVEGFMHKWIALQERITETLPLIPVYSNVYFDFYTRELYDYDIVEAVTWGEAIVPAYMSAPETLDASANDAIEEELKELEHLFIDE